MTYISDIQLDDRNLPSPTPEIDQERKLAIFELLESNSFSLNLQPWVNVLHYGRSKIILIAGDRVSFKNIQPPKCKTQISVKSLLAV